MFIYGLHGVCHNYSSRMHDTFFYDTNNPYFPFDSINQDSMLNGGQLSYQIYGRYGTSGLFDPYYYINLFGNNSTSGLGLATVPANFVRQFLATMPGIYYNYSLCDTASWVACPKFE